MAIKERLPVSSFRVERSTELLILSVPERLALCAKSFGMNIVSRP